MRKAGTLALSGEALEKYLAVFARLLEGGRLNQYFPEAGSLRNLFSCFSPAVNHGLYESLLINTETGLPQESEYGRVWTDAGLAGKSLAQEPLEQVEADASPKPTAVNLRRLARARYLKHLAALGITPSSRLDLRLKWVDEKERVAHFVTLFDRYSLSDNLFVRYTIHLRQKDSRWSRQQVELVGDDLEYTSNFRNAISKFSADESEFAFILINDLKNIEVDECTRGRVGPLYFAGMKAPPRLQEILRRHKGSYVLSFPLDRTARSIRADWNNDPFSLMYRDCLEPGAKEAAERKACLAGYHVSKDRKFVCTPEVEGELRAFLAARGVKSIIYTA